MSDMVYILLEQEEYESDIIIDAFSSEKSALRKAKKLSKVFIAQYADRSDYIFVERREDGFLFWEEKHSKSFASWVITCLRIKK